MGIPLDAWSGSKATVHLEQTILKYSETATQQAKKMIRLTWAIVGLTVAMLVGLVVQVCLSLPHA